MTVEADAGATPASSTSVTEPASVAGDSGTPAPPPRGPLARRKASGGDPVYPEMSKRLQEEGAVELGVEVGNDGGLREVRVLRSSGCARLDEAAVLAVRGWTFTPRTGEEPSMVYRQRFVFRLQTQR